jgi:hypothetical protein
MLEQVKSKFIIKNRLYSEKFTYESGLQAITTLNAENNYNSIFTIKE